MTTEDRNQGGPIREGDLDDYDFGVDIDPSRLPSRARELGVPLRQRTLRRAWDLVTNFTRRFAPQDYRYRVREQLQRAGWPTDAAFDRFIALRLASLILAPFVLLGWALAIPGATTPVLLSGVAVAVLVGIGPDLGLAEAVRQREARIRKELPELIDLLVLCVDAGLGFDTALARAVLTLDTELSQEFSVALGEMRAGANRSDALDRVATRASVQEVRTFVSALSRADVYGVPLADTLRQKAVELRGRRQQRAQRKARQSPVKMLLPMVLFIFPPLLLITIGPAIIDIADAFDIP